MANPYLDQFGISAEKQRRIVKPNDTEGNGALGHLVDAAQAGGAGVLGGQLRTLAEYSPFGGEWLGAGADYFDEVAERNTPTKELEGVDYVAGAIGNALGSGGITMAEIGVLAGLGGALGLGAVGAGAFAGASRLPMLGRAVQGAQTLAKTNVGKAILASAAGKTLEAPAEMGHVIKEARESGMSQDEINQAALRSGTANLGLGVVEGLVESTMLGKLTGALTEGMSKSGKRAFAKGLVMGGLGNAATEGAAETVQSAISDYALDRPINWEQAVGEGKMGAVGGLFLGGLGGGFGSYLNYLDQQRKSEQTQQAPKEEIEEQEEVEQPKQELPDTTPFVDNYDEMQEFISPAYREVLAKNEEQRRQLEFDNLYKELYGIEPPMVSPTPPQRANVGFGRTDLKREQPKQRRIVAPQAPQPQSVIPMSGGFGGSQPTYLNAGHKGETVATVKQPKPKRDYVAENTERYKGNLEGFKRDYSNYINGIAQIYTAGGITREEYDRYMSEANDMFQKVRQNIPEAANQPKQANYYETVDAQFSEGEPAQPNLLMGGNKTPQETAKISAQQEQIAQPEQVVTEENKPLKAESAADTIKDVSENKENAVENSAEPKGKTVESASQEYDGMRATEYSVTGLSSKSTFQNSQVIDYNGRKALISGYALDLKFDEQRGKNFVHNGTVNYTADKVDKVLRNIRPSLKDDIVLNRIDAIVHSDSTKSGAVAFTLPDGTPILVDANYIKYFEKMHGKDLVYRGTPNVFFPIRVYQFDDLVGVIMPIRASEKAIKFTRAIAEGKVSIEPLQAKKKTSKATQVTSDKEAQSQQPIADDPIDLLPEATKNRIGEIHKYGIEGVDSHEISRVDKYGDDYYYAYAGAMHKIDNIETGESAELEAAIAEDEARYANAVAKEEAKKKEQEELAKAMSMDGYTDNMTPMKRGKVYSLLSAKKRFNGKIMVVADYLKSQAEEGYSTEATEWQKGKLYLLNNGQDGASMQLSKTEFEYYNWLTANKEKWLQEKTADDVVGLKYLTEEGKKVFSQIVDILQTGNDKVSQSAKMGAIIYARRADNYAATMRKAGNKDYTALDYFNNNPVQIGGEVDKNALKHSAAMRKENKTYVTNSKGNVDWGYIANIIDVNGVEIKEAPLRVQIGFQVGVDTAGNGYTHIHNRHLEFLQAKGYESIEEAAYDILENFNFIVVDTIDGEKRYKFIKDLRPRTSIMLTLDLVKDDKTGEEFYTFNSFMPRSKGQMKAEEQKALVQPEERSPQDQSPATGAFRAFYRNKAGSVKGSFARNNTNAIDTISIADVDRYVKKYTYEDETFKQTASEKDLVAYHNTNAVNLSKALESGGLAVPSIAIARKDDNYTKFGDITLVGTRDLIDPQKGADVYSKDAYTARMPEKEYAKPKVSAIKSFLDEWKERIENINRDEFYTIKEHLDRNRMASAKDSFVNGVGAKYYYLTSVLGKKIDLPLVDVKYKEDLLKQKGFAREFEKIKDKHKGAWHTEESRREAGEYISKFIDGIIANDESKVIREAWKDLKPLYVSSDGEANINLLREMSWGIDRAKAEAGKVDWRELRRRIHKEFADELYGNEYEKWANAEFEKMAGEPVLKLGRKYVPYNLENIVAYFLKNKGSGKEGTLTFSDKKLAAASSKKFKDIADIRANKGLLQDEDAVDAQIEKSEALLDEFRMELTEQRNLRYPRTDLWRLFEEINEALAKVAGKDKLTRNDLRRVLHNTGQFKYLDNDVLDMGLEALITVKNTATEYFEAKPQRAVNVSEFAGAVVPNGTNPKLVKELKEQGLQVEFYDPKEKDSRMTAIRKIQRDNENVLFQTAYHGSPYQFTNFDLGNIGTGEGAQAHGWGLYFARDKAIAENYKNEFAYREIRQKLKTLNPRSKEYDIMQQVLELTEYVVLGDSRDDVIQEAEEDGGYNPEAIERFKKEQYGSLYEVDVPNDNVMLSEDKSLNEQPLEVRKAILKYYKSRPDEYITPESLTELGEDSGKNFYKEVVFQMRREGYGNPERMASELLNTLGIKGITYNGGKDGHCFVVFDDKAVSIINRYNQIAQGESQNAKGETAIIGEGKKVIKLFKSADESTFIHEVGHIAYADLEEQASMENAPEQIKQDLKTVDDWAEWQEGQIAEYEGTAVHNEFKKLDEDIRKALEDGDTVKADKLKYKWKQERFARGFEEYLRQGDAPTNALEKVFRKFKEWLSEIYQGYKSIGGVPSKEVQAVMGRMILAKQETAENKLGKQFSLSKQKDQYDRTLEEIIDDITEIFGKDTEAEPGDGGIIVKLPNGTRIMVKIEDKLIMNPESLGAAYKAHNISPTKMVTIAGYWEKVTAGDIDGVLAISKRSPIGTAFHEAMHMAYALALTKAERVALLRSALKEAQRTGTSVDEVIAERYREWVLARKEGRGTAFGKLFQKIKDFFYKLKALLQGRDNAHNVMRKVESREVFERKLSSDTVANSRQALVTNADITGETLVPVIDVTGLPKMDTTISAVKAAIAKNLIGKTFRIIGSNGIGRVASISDGKHVVNSSQRNQRYIPVRRQAMNVIEDVLNNAVYIEKHDDVRHGSSGKYIELYAVVKNKNDLTRFRIVAKEGDKTAGEYEVKDAKFYDIIKDGTITANTFKNVLPASIPNGSKGRTLQNVPSKNGITASKPLKLADRQIPKGTQVRLKQDIPSAISVADLLTGVNDRNGKPYVNRFKGLNYEPGVKQLMIDSGGDDGEAYVIFNENQINTTRKYSLVAETPTEEKLRKAVVTTKPQSVVKEIKEKGFTAWAKDRTKNFYREWVDKNNSLHELDALCADALGRPLDDKEKIYDKVQTLPAASAGMAHALIEGDAKHISAINKKLKKKLPYNVTLKTVMEAVGKKVMDKSAPDYLKKYGFENWVEALGGYLGWRRMLEMAEIHGDDYKLPEGLTKAELRKAIANAPAQFSKAADLYYKLNDNILTIMEDAQMISEELHNLLNTKYKNYCPLMRDFSDTAAFDTFIGGITAGGRGIGNVSSTLKKISKTGSERDIINPLESTVKAISVTMNRAERNKVGLAAVELAKTAGLKGVIERVEPHKEKGKIVEATADPKNCIFTVMENGKKVAYRTTQEFYAPIVGYNLPNAGIVFGVMRTAAQCLRTGATMSPSFIIRNVLRDTIFAGISSKNGFVPFVDTIKGANALLNDKELKAMYETAGVGEFNFYNTAEKAYKSLVALNGGKELDLHKPSTIFKAMLKYPEQMSAFMESATRMGEFKRAIENGADIDTAARMARELTLDFSRSGIYGERVNTYVPFFNAVIQGGDKLYRLFRDRPVETSVQIARYIVLPSVLLWAWNHDEEWYKELDPQIKNTNWCLPGGIRIPKPNDVGVIFGSGIEAMFDLASQEDPEAIANWARTIRDNSLPNFIPTLFLPIIEWNANYSFYRKGELVSQRLKRLPDELQYTSGTSTASRELGALTGASPVKIDNLVRGYTGTMGAFMWQVFNLIDPKKQQLPEKKMSELPFIRDFNITEANRNRQVNEFYELLERANKQHAGYGVKGSPNGYVKAVRQIGKQIADLNKDIRNIQESKLSPTEKRERIDVRRERIRKLSKFALTRFKDKI